jgi:hypothetical protein
MNKTKRTLKIIGGILLIILGWLSLGVGFTIKCPHPCSTTIFLGGFVLIIIGIIVLVIKNKNSIQQ